MSHRSDSLLFDDIKDAAERIRVYTDGLDEDGFTKDRKTSDAAVRNLEIIGEAAARLSDRGRGQIAGVEWPQIVGLRNRIVEAIGTSR